MIRPFEGKTPQIAGSAFVSEAAYIVGDVEIGEDASIWPGAVIRGDFGKIRIGRNTAVEDNCVLHCGSPDNPSQDLVIGDYVQIGHAAVINGERIGDHVLIGMNATVLHDVQIGDNCIIGAGCLVPHGMQIPDGSFVIGVPGVIKGSISKEQRFWVEQAPKEYAALMKRYRDAGL
jgi:carbonic anhydrase/acetyltransferase-like protein (isoleucine patch superfamily)